MQPRPMAGTVRDPSLRCFIAGPAFGRSGRARRLVGVGVLAEAHDAVALDIEHVGEPEPRIANAAQLALAPADGDHAAAVSERRLGVDRQLLPQLPQALEEAPHVVASL